MQQPEWRPATKRPLDYYRIGNCNLDYCEEGTRTESSMEVGLMEEAAKFVREELYNDPIYIHPNARSYE